ncbi:efflux transporter outer membrane subunit [Methylotuvimicrobium alcaliphilum]|uniref:RND efflux system, outer membrane lipoprotein, NodT family n=1 Tax=Methylotuvimicrobium alcaliphilum (strain DSM 19304 / NCIMB 14124 / VKM B-2133 / 20Z) TaxID=1091494 RepID=G4T2J3_META2|nr:efflux transporter outer membrane subunit [Methylotuvimicrobium alcaliphilum]CCE24722.1 RND efflux system, outer membrane lipoprotein, NodT family [Methylotuvimicrobium alcaliphilum 20Z]
MTDNLAKQHTVSACLLGGTLLIAGCAWFPESTQRAVMNALPEIGQTISEAQQRLPATDRWPDPAWWDIFNNPQLQTLIEASLESNPDLKATAARLSQAQSMVDAQAAELYPTVHANITFNAQRFSANSVQVKFAGENFRHMLINPLILRYHLDFWGRDKAALQAAVGRAVAVENELADAKLLLSATVAQGYFDLSESAEKLKLIQQIVRHKEALLKLEQTRLELGLVERSAPLTTGIELNAAREIEAAFRAKVDLQRHLLAALAGRGPDWGQSIAADPSLFPKRLNLPADLPLSLLAHRPDIAAARLHAEAAAEEIKVAETAFYPDVNLIAFTGLHSVSMTDVMLQGASLAYAVGPSIEFPIFEGGRLRANLTYQEATYDAAVERYNASLLHAVQEVADALTRWQEIEDRLAKHQHSLEAAQSNESLAQTLNRAGLNNRSDLLEARIQVLDQRYHLATLENERFKTAVQLFKALGGGYTENDKL